LILSLVERFLECSFFLIREVPPRVGGLDKMKRKG